MSILSILERGACAAATVVLAALAIAQPASAAGWAIQPTPNPVGWPQTDLHGVSCPSGTDCMAVGNPSFVGSSAFDAMDEFWNGASWKITFGQRLPANPNNQFNAVSCPSSKSCEAVGYYQPGPGVRLPLAEVWSGTSWSAQPVQLPSGATSAELNGVSCSSATSCKTVGTSFDSSGTAAAVVESWDGVTWTVQPTTPVSGSLGTFLNGVSCTSASSCLAVGYTIFGGRLTQTFAERWNGSGWFFEFPPDKSSFNVLDGVSCTLATSCMAVGQYFDPITHDQMTLGEFSSGTARWTLQTSPSPGQTFSVVQGVSCTANGGCIAVGSYDTFRGVPVPLIDSWDGANWSFVSLPTPPGAISSNLKGVSCSAATACTAVGNYKNSVGSILTLAERFSGGGSPRALSLTRGGDVLALLHKPRTLELLVFGHPERQGLLGAVPLGHHPKGRSRTRWDLRVGGHRLRAGRYTAELVAVFGRGATSAGPSVTFELTRGERIRVLSASCPVAAANGRC